MLNILIADDNIYYAKSLVNFISSKNDKIRLINISTDGREVLNTIFSEKVDIIILDLKMPNLSGIDVLDIISKKKMTDYPKIIVVSGEIELISKVKNNPLVEYCISKSSGIKRIYSIIENIITSMDLEENNKKIKSIILNELLYLGYNIKHKGTKYLLDILYEIYILNQTDIIDNLEKYYYSRIAKKYSKSVQNIKSNIIKSTDYMYMECEQSKIKEYFNYTYDYKPTPKVVINTIISKINK